MVVIVLLSMLVFAILWSVLVIISDQKKHKMSRTFYPKTK